MRAGATSTRSAATSACCAGGVSTPRFRRANGSPRTRRRGSRSAPTRGVADVLSFAARAAFAAPIVLLAVAAQGETRPFEALPPPPPGHARVYVFRGAQLPEPPAGPREVTIRLRTGSSCREGARHLPDTVPSRSRPRRIACRLVASPSSPEPTRGSGSRSRASSGREGNTVYLGARDAERGRAAAEKLRAEGLDARALALDVTDDASVAAAAAQVEKEAGPARRAREQRGRRDRRRPAEPRLDGRRAAHVRDERLRCGARRRRPSCPCCAARTPAGS